MTMILIGYVVNSFVRLLHNNAI